MTAVTITGTYRSGTTLVERLFDQHPDAAILSQPLPHLWLAAKRAYLTDRGVERSIPLGPLFRDPHHDPDALGVFLARWPHDPGPILEEVAASQRHFSGAMTPEVASLSGAVPADLPTGFAPLLSWAYRALSDATGRPGADLVGAKEIVVDEFVPALLAAGHHVVIVLRDVRSVVASAVHGAGRDYVGAARPTLFTVRTWRRTAAMALAHQDHPRCHVMRYEDVVDAPSLVAPVWQACGLSPEAVVPTIESLRDQYGHEWSANTSFGSEARNGADSVERAIGMLDPRTLGYVNATTGPELLALGYEDGLVPDPERALHEFVEPVPISRRGLDSDFSTSPAAVSDELRRLELVTDCDLDVAVAREWFILVEAHRALCDARRRGRTTLLV